MSSSLKSGGVSSSLKFAVDGLFCCGNVKSHLGGTFLWFFLPNLLQTLLIYEGQIQDAPGQPTLGLSDLSSDPFRRMKIALAALVLLSSVLCTVHGAANVLGFACPAPRALHSQVR